MNTEHLSDAIGNLDEKLCAEANEVRKKKRRPRWIAWVAAAACISVAALLLKPLLPKSQPSGTPSMSLPASEDKIPLGTSNKTMLLDLDTSTLERMIAIAEYPKMEQYPAQGSAQSTSYSFYGYNEQLDSWFASRESINSSVNAPERKNYFNDFYRLSAQEFLKCGTDENILFSPSNVYMALAMLAELTDGESRQQILDLLGTQSVETLRAEAKHLWTSNYSDDGVLTTIMANSLWLNEDLPYNQKTMDLLAKDYYASSFQGKMGSDAYNGALRDWLNKHTGGLLKDHVNDLSFDPATVMALASTIYFNGRWDSSFKQTQPQTFYANSGAVTVDFMKSVNIQTAYWGESFTAIQKSMQNGASMWLILPDEGKTVEDVITEGEIFEMTSAGATWPQNKSVIVNLAMPKFDVTSKLDLVGGLKRLGVRDIFDHSISDFSPMTDAAKDIYVSKAEHAVRVRVDEDGCEAAAYALLVMSATGAICTEEIDFVLDRPFIFVITGCGDQPLFIGVVNQV